MDKFDKDFDKAFKIGVGAWLVALGLSIVLWGVAIWAVVMLVLHFTK